MQGRYRGDMGRDWEISGDVGSSIVLPASTFTAGPRSHLPSARSSVRLPARSKPTTPTLSSLPSGGARAASSAASASPPAASASTPAAEAPSSAAAAVASVFAFFFGLDAVLSLWLGYIAAAQQNGTVGSERRSVASQPSAAARGTRSILLSTRIGSFSQSTSARSSAAQRQAAGSRASSTTSTTSASESTSGSGAKLARWRRPWRRCCAFCFIAFWSSCSCALLNARSFLRFSRASCSDSMSFSRCSSCSCSICCLNGQLFGIPGSFLLCLCGFRLASRRCLRWCSRTLRSTLCLSWSDVRFDLRAFTTLPGLTILPRERAPAAAGDGRRAWTGVRL